jgi:hypothetical protein
LIRLLRDKITTLFGKIKLNFLNEKSGIDFNQLKQDRYVNVSHRNRVRQRGLGARFCDCTFPSVNRFLTAFLSKSLLRYGTKFESTPEQIRIKRSYRRILPRSKILFQLLVEEFKTFHRLTIGTSTVDHRNGANCAYVLRTQASPPDPYRS